MKKISLLILAIVSFYACTNSYQLENIPKTSEIRGLATPIQLSGNITDINLEDYFLDVSKIDSAKVSSEFDLLLSPDKKFLKIVSTNPNVPTLSTLDVWISGSVYSILVKKYDKIPVEISFDARGKKIEKIQVKGQFNSWNSNIDTMKFMDGAWKTTIYVKPGKYQYVFILNGKEILDPANPIKEDNGMGGFNSVIIAGNSDKSKQPFLYIKDADNDIVTIGNVQNTAKVIVLWDNYCLPDGFVTLSNNIICIAIPENAKSINRSHIRVWAYNEFGISNDLLIPLAGGSLVTSTTQLDRSDLHAQIMYFLMVDRFNNGNKNNDKKVDDPEILPKANYFGGDLAGVTQKIRDNYFQSLGVNTIWLSPITQNPLEAWGLNKEPRTKFSGYHGYWPISLSKVDFRFGTADELHELVESAHSNGLNIIQDYVANHIHQNHPAYQSVKSWFTPLYLPDGTMNTEKWDEYRLTTWFDTFLPKFNFEAKEVYEPLSDSVLYWLKEFDIDGFRHDATKHIHENFWRRVTYKIKHQIPNSKFVFQIGETYGGPELINSYISSGLLDSQFDFNVYDAALSSIGNPMGSFTNLNSKITESLGIYGYHNLMGYISGNQDRGRFISYAGGSLRFDENAKYAGWTRNIEVGDPVGYKRLCMLNAFNMTIPGIPTIYYGDEFGMPGGNDPDNRRMMKFNGFTEDEVKTLEITKKLIHLRRENMALNYGEFIPLVIDDNVYAYARVYLHNKVIVVFNKSNISQNIRIDLPDYLQSSSYSSNFDTMISLYDKYIEVTLNPNSFDIIISKL